MTTFFFVQNDVKETLVLALLSLIVEFFYFLVAVRGNYSPECAEFQSATNVSIN